MPVDIKLVPARRSADLVVRVQDDETLVLDTRTDTAHCLPAEVARVWDACTPGRTLAEVAAAAGLDEAVVSSSIDQLLGADLLEVRAGVDRRKFLRRTVIVGGSAAAIPLIQSVVGPSAIAAATMPAPTCNAVIQQTGCVNPHKATYTLTVSGLSSNTSYNVKVTYKNNSVSDDFPITTGAGGISVSNHTTGASIPQGSAGDVVVEVFTLSGVLVCRDTGLSFAPC